MAAINGIQVDVKILLLRLNPFFLSRHLYTICRRLCSVLRMFSGRLETERKQFSSNSARTEQQCLMNEVHRESMLCVFHLALFLRHFKFSTGIASESLRSVCPTRTRQYRSGSMEWLFMETVAGEGRSQDFALNLLRIPHWSLTTKRIHCTQSGISSTLWLTLSGIYCITQWHVTRRMLQWLNGSCVCFSLRPNNFQNCAQ
jgi:hypothetical protein